VGAELANLHVLKLETRGLGDAGDPPMEMVISVSGKGELYFYQRPGAPAVATATSMERQRLSELLGGSGVLTELLADGPCGRPWADYNEWLTTYVGQRNVRKEITDCKQEPYAAVRAFLLGLREAHFRWPSGTCPAPNVWRYMSPGCGAEARPVCGTSIGDGCAAPRCSCDGRDIVGCDFTSEPYAFAGYCRDGGRGN
jgi:hypothetical protein